MNELFYLLLMGHFLGDFVFQTSTIAAYKNKNLKHLLLHSLIVFVCELAAISFLWSLTNILLVFILSCSHFAVDFVKLRYNSMGFTNNGFYYLVDQFFHVLVIVIIAWFFDSGKQFIPLSIALSTTIFVVNSFFSDILIYFFARQKKSEPYQRKFLDYLFRGVSFFPFLINFFLGILYLPVAFVLSTRFEKNRKRLLFKYIFTFFMNLLFLMLWRRII